MAEDRCPHCAGQIVPTMKTCPYCQRSLAPAAPRSTRKCRFCAEEIQDAAIVCKHCGRDLIPGRATASVPLTPAAVASAPAPRAARSNGGGRVLIAVGILIVLGLWLLSRENTAPTAPRAAAKVLNVSVAWSASTLQITNTGSPAGTAVTAYINGAPPFTYKAEGTLPTIGEHLQIPLRLFVTKSGERFNPVTHAVTVAWVGGGGYDYGSFGKGR